MRRSALALVTWIPLLLLGGCQSTPPSACPELREPIALEDDSIGVTGWSLIERLFVFPSKHPFVYTREQLASVEGGDPTLIMSIEVVGEHALAVRNEKNESEDSRPACIERVEVVEVAVDIKLRAKDKSIPPQRFVGYARGYPESARIDIEARTLRMLLPHVVLRDEAEAVRVSNEGRLRISISEVGEVEGELGLDFDGIPSIELGRFE